MITLITGLPGNGKTLFALCHIRALAEKSGRKVFYSGIAGLTLPWELFGGDAAADKPHETNPGDWHKLPKGSIIVIDECQRLFRPRANGSVVPEYESKLETHRHEGYDIFLITQHPMLISSNVRRLVGQHFHTVRTFGMQRATVHEWGSVKENCDKVRSDSVRHEFKYPAEAFGWYKSAEIHTHKRRVPARLVLLLVLPFVLIGMAYGVYAWLRPMFSAADNAPGQKVKEGPTKPITGAPVASAAAPVPVGYGSPADVAQYAARRTPRLAGLPDTAPIYDKAAENPKAIPRPAACIATASRCQCWTQQATRIPDVPEPTCRQIAQYGYFDNQTESGYVQTQAYRPYAPPEAVPTVAAAPASPPAAAAPVAPPVAPAAPVPPVRVPQNSQWRYR